MANSPGSRRRINRRWSGVRRSGLAPFDGVRCALLLIVIATGLALAKTVEGAAELDQSQTVPQAERSEFRGLLPLTSFYSTPSPLPAGRPGELRRSEGFDEYQLPEGVSAFRILYHSRSADGEDVAASGVVLVPD